jgi:apolipoprotein D and lipocalin family protein
MRTAPAKTPALALAAVLAASLCGCVAGPVGNPHPPQPTKPVELSRYLGRYYEFARYENGFERGCQGVTAEYGLLPSGLVSVLNTCHKGALDAPPTAVHGRAKPTGDVMHAKLKVSFFGPFFVGDYWVLDHADDYSWSIVGEGSGRFLWVLTRDPAPSPALSAGLLERVASLGYDVRLLSFTRQ